MLVIYSNRKIDLSWITGNETVRLRTTIFLQSDSVFQLIPSVSCEGLRELQDQILGYERVEMKMLNNMDTKSK